jgi:hypothetical protein
MDEGTETPIGPTKIYVLPKATDELCSVLRHSPKSGHLLAVNHTFKLAQLSTLPREARILGK